jgi:hypothetical protein
MSLTYLLLSQVSFIYVNIPLSTLLGQIRLY